MPARPGVGDAQLVLHGVLEDNSIAAGLVPVDTDFTSGPSAQAATGTINPSFIVF